MYNTPAVNSMYVCCEECRMVLCIHLGMFPIDYCSPKLQESVADQGRMQALRTPRPFHEQHSQLGADHKLRKEKND